MAVCAVSCNGVGTNEPVATIPEPVNMGQDETIQEKERLLVSKGVIRSDSEIKVYSTIEGQLLDVKLIEGDRVNQGKVLFRLDDTEIKSRIALSESKYEQAQLQMEEILVGQGYKRNALDQVPEATKEYARIKSGLNVSKSELEQNQIRLGNTVIKAPLNGVITDIQAIPYGFVEPGQTLCTIVDPDRLIVKFSILETELRKFQVGTVVEIRSIAYSDKAYDATVRSIGSVVDENGMIKVEAVIADPENLMPGMTAIINL